MPPVQRVVPVVGSEPVGAYHRLTVLAPDIAATAEPGQFVAFAVGGPDSGLLLRRAFSVYAADAVAGTVSVIVAVAGPGTAWLAARHAGDEVDLVGPLGRGFVLPSRPVTAVLVGGGYGAAPLFALARTLRSAGSRVRTVLGASTQARLFGLDEAHGVSDAVSWTTDDGSAGRRGRVTDALDDQLTGAGVVYACGPMAMLRAVSAAGADRGVPVQVAVEEAMACGIGVCMTCVLPVAGADGGTTLVRSCVEGPVFPGDRVRFGAIGLVLGAHPAGAGAR